MTLSSLGWAGLMTFSAVAWASGASPADKFLAVEPVPDVKVARGGSAEAVVSLRIQPGFHLQSNPAANPQLIPTRLEIKGPKGIQTREVAYPPGKPYRLQGAPGEISVYEGTVSLRVPLRADKSAKAGKHTLDGKLRFQACDDKICFFPVSAPVTIPVEVR